MKANQSTTFRLFKYSVYALLTLNIFIFFQEEYAAMSYRFANGIGFGELIEGFAATIDTAAWVVLLLIFELETYVLEDRHFTRRVNWGLTLVRAACYIVIVYAFFGYLTKLLYLLAAAPSVSIADLCAIVDGQWAYAVDLDEYLVLTADNCAALGQAGEFIRLPDTRILVSPDDFRAILWLAWTDVINAGVWLGVVAVLELDVQLQTRGRLEGTVARVSNAAKHTMYAILLLAAIYWGVKGDFVDFWDAFLWLVAFVFIELNVLEWREEDREISASGKTADGAA